MSPLPYTYAPLVTREVTKPTDPNGLVLEAWAEGYMLGSLIIMSCITLANMRKGVLLHNLILLELVFGYWQGVFILFNPPIYSWWLSIAAIPLNISWVLHNVISWMKLRPFMSKFWSRVFIGTVALTIPYWVVEIYANFTYFHNVNDVFLRTRPWEALCRDPWWIVAAAVLFYNIKTKYDLGALQIARISPRFAVMLGAMVISIAFIVVDVLSVTDAFKSVLPVGINPFWKLAFVFKCLTDSVVLDDFKTALDRLRAFKMSRLGSFAGDNIDSRVKSHHETVQRSNNWDEPPSHSGAPVPIGTLPRIPNADPDPNDALDHNHDLSTEQRYAVMTRKPSRDRDIEENAVVTTNDSELPDRQDSSALILGHQQSPSWPQRFSAATSEDADLEYAAAMREVAEVVAHRRSGNGLGLAR